MAPRRGLRYAQVVRITVLSGGVGGAKIVEGLAAVAGEANLTVIGNPGDDIDLHGLRISPDLDIVTYTLAGIVDRERGWGIAGDTFAWLAATERLGGPTWFHLGDRDLATHVLRTRLLAEGRRATDVALEICRRLGVLARVIPPTDDDVRTDVRTPEGWMGFQEYFVRDACRHEILDVAYRGAEAAHPTQEALAAIAGADAIVVAPSNPVASIGPILAVPGVRAALRRAGAPRIAVSPLVAGRSLKGPSDRMMRALGHEADARGVARFYAGLVDVLVIDEADAALAPEVEAAGVRALIAPTVMRSAGDRAALARRILDAVRAGAVA